MENQPSAVVFILCIFGTWNDIKKDSNLNISHAMNLRYGFNGRLCRHKITTDHCICFCCYFPCSFLGTAWGVQVNLLGNICFDKADDSTTCQLHAFRTSIFRMLLGTKRSTSGGKESPKSPSYPLKKLQKTQFFLHIPLWNIEMKTYWYSVDLGDKSKLKISFRIAIKSYEHKSCFAKKQFFNETSLSQIRETETMM